ncbi:hypothetical protein M2167_000346 [Streptomyces sp. SPB4]|nr:hypothetical protein [Streptomyces sp. SPB4]
MDTDRLQFLTPFFEELRVVDLGVVDHNRAGLGPLLAGWRLCESLGSAGQESDAGADEVQDHHRVDLVGDGGPHQFGVRAGCAQGAQHVDAAALGVLLLDQGAAPGAGPGEGGGQGRGEPRLVQAMHVLQAGFGPQSYSRKPSSRSLAAAWRAGSALCRRLSRVRFRRNPSRCSSTDSQDESMSTPRSRRSYSVSAGSVHVRPSAAEVQHRRQRVQVLPRPARWTPDASARSPSGPGPSAASGACHDQEASRGGNCRCGR